MRAIGLTPSDFRPRSLTIMTPEAPSQIWLALAAVSLPFSAISLTPLMPSRVASNRIPSSMWWGSVEPLARVICSGTISALKRPACVAAIAGLHHAAHDDVFDLCRIGAGAFDQRIQHGCGQIGRMPTGETSPLAAACGTCGGDDIGLGHVCSPWIVVGLESWAGFKGWPGI